MAVSLANSYDLVVNRLSIVVGNNIVNVRDLISAGGCSTSVDAYTKAQMNSSLLLKQSTADAYTRAQVDSSLLLKQNTLSWLTGDSTAKNTNSTGDGILSIASPGANGSLTTAIMVNGPYYTGKVGQVNIYTEVVMLALLKLAGQSQREACVC
jgi:hypothetical protein